MRFVIAALVGLLGAATVVLAAKNRGSAGDRVHAIEGGPQPGLAYSRAIEPLDVR